LAKGHEPENEGWRRDFEWEKKRQNLKNAASRMRGEEITHIGQVARKKREGLEKLRPGKEGLNMYQVLRERGRNKTLRAKNNKKRTEFAPLREALGRERKGREKEGSGKTESPSRGKRGASLGWGQ